MKEQQAFFADIDAFNLDEKEVYFGPSPQEPEEDRMEPQAAQDELSNFHHPNKPLEAVPEEGSAKITSQMLDDLLTAALVTPQPLCLQTGCKNVPVQMSPKSAFTPGFPTSRTVLRTSFGFPDLSLFSKLLDSEQAIPSPETLRDETSRQSLPGACSRLSFSANYRASEEGLFFDSQSLISGLESLQIREEDNQLDCSKIDLCTPILEEDNCLGAISEEEFPGGKVESHLLIGQSRWVHWTTGLLVDRIHVEKRIVIFLLKEKFHGIGCLKFWTEYHTLIWSLRTENSYLQCGLSLSIYILVFTTKEICGRWVGGK